MQARTAYTDWHNQVAGIVYNTLEYLGNDEWAIALLPLILTNDPNVVTIWHDRIFLLKISPPNKLSLIHVHGWRICAKILHDELSFI